MSLLFDKFILLISCTLLFLHCLPQVSCLHVLAFLCSIIFLCLCSCCNLEALPLRQLPSHTRPALILLWLLLGMASLLHPAFGFLLPFLSYELSVASGGYFHLFVGLLPFLSFRRDSPFACQSSASLPHPAPQENLTFYAFMVLLLCLLAWGLAWRTKELMRLKQEFRLLRDTSTEYNLLLQQKNQDLLEKQNHEIHIATLKERNRIAREIHDNVGHMLSRSLLQSGALMAVNQQENLKEPLNALKDTLSSAMDAIRSSVHGLHDDSIDLESAITDLLSGFANYQVSLNYDMGRFVPSAVKYCFISVTKEALANIVRHSKATKISLTLREHPSFYQLVVEDNGTGADRTEAQGIGLLNMKERVDSLNGHFSVSSAHGFRIFVSVPNNADRRN